MQQKRQINKQKKSVEKVDNIIQELVERIRKEKGIMNCCVCEKQATVEDTEYSEFYCDKHADSYEIFDGPYRIVRADEVVEVDPDDLNATVCGTCGRAWDDRVITPVTPTPAGRCPFEYDHESE